MLLSHVGIINKNEEQAARFYEDFLGFEMTKEYVVPPELSEQLFAVSDSVRMMVFEKAGIKIEVFISPEYKPPYPEFRHIGFLLDDFSKIVEKAPRSGIELITGRTKDKEVYFMKDFAGNLIEIKQK